MNRLMIPGLNVQSLLAMYSVHSTSTIAQTALLPLTGSNLLGTMTYCKVPKDDLTIIGVFLHTCEFADTPMDILKELELVTSTGITLNYNSYIVMLRSLLRLEGYQEFKEISRTFLGLKMELQVDCVEFLARGFNTCGTKDLNTKLYEYCQKERILVTNNTIECWMRDYLPSQVLHSHERPKAPIESCYQEFNIEKSQKMIDKLHQMSLLIHGSITDGIAEVLIRWNLYRKQSDQAIKILLQDEDPSHLMCSAIWQSECVPDTVKFNLYKRAGRRILPTIQDFESLFQISNDECIKEIYDDFTGRSDLEITDPIKKRMATLNFIDSDIQTLLEIQFKN